MRALSFCALTWLTVTTALLTGAEGPIATGVATVTFSERHPESSFEAMDHRWHWPPQVEMWKQGAYDIAAESFTTYVPATYDGTRPFGLVVWLTDGDDGGVVPGWAPILDAHDLVWVGANKAGHGRNMQSRLALALDAEHNMTKRYRIDPERVYVGGGPHLVGRVANWELVTYPDVFTGSLSVGVCDFHRTISGGVFGGTITGFVAGLDPRLMELARTRRIVLIAGELDTPNLNKMRMVADAYEKDGFHRLTAFEVPALAQNTFPAGDWLERAVHALDRPLRWRLPSGDGLAQALERAGVKGGKSRFQPGQPIKTPLSDARAKVARGGAQAAEATLIVQTVEAWVEAEIRRLTDLAQHRPARATGELELVVKLVRGLPEEVEVQHLLQTLRQQPNVVELVRLRSQGVAVFASIDKQGPGDAVNTTRATLRRALTTLKAKSGDEAGVVEEIDDMLLDL